MISRKQSFRRTSSFITIAVIATALGFGGCRSAESEQTSTTTAALDDGPRLLSGAVFGGGNRLPDTLVEALANGTTDIVGTSTTDSGGFYQLSLADGTYDLRVTPPAGSGFSQQSIQDVVLAGADRREDLILIAIAKGAVVAGRVRGHDGVGLAGVNLSAYDATTGILMASATTKDTGAYEMSPGAGTYTFVVSPSSLPAGAPNGGWYEYLYNQTISGATTLDIDLPIAKVEGNATDPDGASVPNASISAYGYGNDGASRYWYSTASAQTGSNGHYELLVFTGPINFTVRPPAPLGPVVQNGVQIDGDVTHDFPLARQTIVDVSGQVHGHAGAGLAGVNVSAYDTNTGLPAASATTNDGGTYQITLATGTYTLVVSPSSLPPGAPNGGWYEYLYNQIISAAMTLDIDLPVAKVEGNATDPDGASVPNTSISAYGYGNDGASRYWYSTASAQTGSDGHYELLVFTGPINFTVRPPAPLGPVVQNGVQIDGDVTHDFPLARQTIVDVSGQLRGHAGVGLAGINVSAYDTNTGLPTASATTDDGGTYQMTLATGTYTLVVSPSSLTAHAPNGGWYEYLYNQPISAATKLDIDLPVAQVVGVMTDANGAPVPNASVSAYGYGSDGVSRYWYSTASAQTGPDGRYQLLVFTGPINFTVMPPANSGFATTVLSNVNVAGDFSQQVVLQIADLSPPVIVAGPTVIHLSDTSVSINWQTNEPADSTVDYGPGGLSQNVASPALVIKHEVTLVDLAPSTVYQYRSGSRDGSGNGPTQSTLLTFRTEDPPGDVTPPVITAGPTVSGVGQDSAVVAWTTNEPATTIVHYGTTAALGTNAAEVGKFTPDHQITLAGLTPNTTYFLRVESTDPDGNGPTLSELASFTTAAVPDTSPPQIVAGPQVAASTNTTLTVVWTTDEPATSGVSYNDGTTFFVVSDDRLATDHEVVLAALKPATTYNITISSTDRAGNGPTLGGPISAQTRSTAPNTTPVITVPADMRVEAAGPNGAQVTFDASARDVEDGELTVLCVPPSGTVFPLGATTVTCSTVDSAGLTAAASFAVTVVDTTPPAFTSDPQRTDAFATCTEGARVSYLPPTAVDLVSGAAAVTCAPTPGSRFAVGSTTVTCHATDGAGNVATTTFTVHVSYEAPTDGTFFLSPIKSDGSGRYKKGSALPVKFRLQGASARIATVAARMLIAPVEAGGVGSYQPASAKGKSNEQNLFRFDRAAQLYVFDLDAGNMAPGVWSLRADLGDNVMHTVRIEVVR